MLIRTHLAISIFAIVLFFPLVANPITFVFITLLATMIPDIDTPFSKLGKYAPAKLIQIFTEHRGAIHSLTICFIISLVFAVFMPLLAFGFFLGYSLHLMADSFTKTGIAPFWPLQKKSAGFFITGGNVEKGILAVFILVDFLLVVARVF